MVGSRIVRSCFNQLNNAYEYITYRGLWQYVKMAILLKNTYDPKYLKTMQLSKVWCHITITLYLQTAERCPPCACQTNHSSANHNTLYCRSHDACVRTTVTTLFNKKSYSQKVIEPGHKKDSYELRVATFPRTRLDHPNLRCTTSGRWVRGATFAG